MQEHPPQDSGGYRRKLIEEEAYKGFTLVELIVVIVILAILAAILIPGLLKWIDEAKDKKYELEAREIALAAEGALTKMYAQGAGALDLEAKNSHYLLKAGGSTDLKGFLGEEIGKFTDAAVEKIEIYGNADGGTPGKWGGSATGFEIAFTPSGETESITASLLPGTGRWEINKSSGESSEDPDAWLVADPGDSAERQQYMRIAQAAVQALRTQYEDGTIEVTVRPDDKLLTFTWTDNVNNINFYLDGWNSTPKGSWLTDDLLSGGKINYIRLYADTLDEGDPTTWQGDIGRFELLDGSFVRFGYDRDSGWIDG